MDPQLASEPPPRRAFDWLVVALLSTTAGAADVIGFVGLGGLLIAHVTESIVVLTVHYFTGRLSPLGPLLAVPVFIAVLGTIAWVSEGKSKHQTLRAILVLQATLLSVFFVVAAWLGPFKNPDGAVAAQVGMLGVAAMAAQHGASKVSQRFYWEFLGGRGWTGREIGEVRSVHAATRGSSWDPDFALGQSRLSLIFPGSNEFFDG